MSWGSETLARALPRFFLPRLLYHPCFFGNTEKHDPAPRRTRRTPACTHLAHNSRLAQSPHACGDASQWFAGAGLSSSIGRLAHGRVRGGKGEGMRPAGGVRALLLWQCSRPLAERRNYRFNLRRNRRFPRSRVATTVFFLFSVQSGSPREIYKGG